MIQLAQDPTPAPGGPTPLDRLGDEVAELAAQIHAANYRLLARLREFDRLFQEAGGSWGFRTCAEWLSWRTGIGPGAAREKVRVARALGALPRISRAMERGALSYSKVRALTRVAGPDSEEELLRFALEGTAAHVERLGRSWRRLDRLEEAEREEARHRRRELSLFVDEDGSYVVRGRLDPEVGALVQKALEMASEALYRRKRGAAADAETAEGEGAAKEGAAEEATATPPQRRADALGLLAERILQQGLGPAASDAPSDAATDAATEPSTHPPHVPAETREAEANGAPGSATRPTDQPASRPLGRADRFQVVVHVEPETLRSDGEGGASFLEGGPRVPAGTSRRLACDAGRVVMTHDPEGRVLDVGRRTRTVPSALRRALDFRDRGCRFPGCGLRFTDAHHIEHWADGGETCLDNLVSLCRRHHRAVHEGGFTVEWAGDGAESGEGADAAEDVLLFRRPDGHILPAAPPLPALSGDPVDGLRRRHRSEGADIDPWTASSLWDGRPFDLGWALDFFRRIDSDEPGPDREERGPDARDPDSGQRRCDSDEPGLDSDEGSG